MKNTPQERGDHSPLSEYHELFHALWTDRSWINRRIDEVQIVSADSTSTKSTFDLNIKRLNEIACENNFPEDEVLPVPLLIQPRKQLLDADIDLNGKPQSLAGTLPSASVAACIYIHDYFSSSKELFDQNFPIVYEPIYKMMIHGANISEKEEEKARESISATEEVRRSESTKEQSIASLVNFIRNYILVVHLDRLNESENAKLTCSFSTMYKTRRNYHTDFSFPRQVIESLKGILLEFKPRRADFPVIINGTQLGTAFEERYHLKFKVPDGQYISSLCFTENTITETVEDEQTKKARQIDPPIRKHGQYSIGKNECFCLACEQPFAINCRVAFTKSSLNIHDLAKKYSARSGVRFSIKIGMEPQFRNFKYPSLVCLLVLCVYLGVAYFYPTSQGTPFDLPAFSLTTAAFFLALPFLFRREREHDFTNMTLRNGRLVLGAIATVCLIIGIFCEQIGAALTQSFMRVGLVYYLPLLFCSILIVMCVGYTLLSMWRAYRRKRTFEEQVSVINKCARFTED